MTTIEKQYHQWGFFIKAPGAGASTAWHQDPNPRWDNDWKSGKVPLGTCGSNFHISLYDCTPGNGLWLLPGSHAWHGRADVKE